MQVQQVEMKGVLRLEGAFLESIIAAYLLSKGEKVVPRPKTRDQQHDVLVERNNGYAFYECTGLMEITQEKIHRFYHDALKLHDRLMESESKGLIEVWFIAATHENAWSSEAKETFKRSKELLEKRLRVEVKLLSSNELLLELLNSGVLGIRLVRDKVFWGGPEDLAIRYSPSEKCFKYDRCPHELIEKFSQTHFSLLPSFYWESYYKTIFEEAVKDKMEFPLSIFTHYPEEGLEWQSINDVTTCYEWYLKSFSRSCVLEKGEDFLLELYTSRRKNRYYTLYLFTLGEQSPNGARYVSSAHLSQLEGKAYLLIEDLKRANKVPANEKVPIVIVSTTQYWSSHAWGAVPEVPKAYKEEVGSQSRVPGNELLNVLLNKGAIGFKFKDKNQITLVGPRIQAVRQTAEGLAITDEPYYT